MRIVADLILLLAAFLLPWWLVLLCTAGLFFLFERFYELFLVALLLDLLYGVPIPQLYNFEFVLSVGAVVLFLALSAVKKRMRV